jgi:hypothetical protein
MIDQAQDEVAARWNQNADQWTDDVRNGYDVYRDLFTFPALRAWTLSILDAVKAPIPDTSRKWAPR